MVKNDEKMTKNGPPKKWILQFWTNYLAVLYAPFRPKYFRGYGKKARYLANIFYANNATGVFPGCDKNF